MQVGDGSRLAFLVEFKNVSSMNPLQTRILEAALAHRER
jgi:hypothetical protein